MMQAHHYQDVVETVFVGVKYKHTSTYDIWVVFQYAIDTVARVSPCGKECAWRKKLNHKTLFPAGNFFKDDSNLCAHFKKYP